MPLPEEMSAAGNQVTFAPATLSKSIFRSSNIRIAVARPAP